MHQVGEGEHVRWRGCGRLRSPDVDDAFGEARFGFARPPAFGGRGVKHFPEAEGFVSCTRDHGAAVWRQGGVEHSGLVASEVCEFGQRGVLPHTQLELAEAVRGDKLLGVSRPQQCADLGARVELFNTATSCSVPEPDAAICTATASGQQVALEGGPPQCADSSCVLTEFEARGAAIAVSTSGLPNRHLVIIATRCQLHTVRAVTQPTHFLRVRNKFTHSTISSQIMS